MSKYHLLPLLALVWLLANATAVPGDELPGDAAKRVKEFEAAAEAIQKKADADIQILQGKLIEDLQALQEAHTKAGKLDEAVAIRDWIRQLKEPYGATIARPSVVSLTLAGAKTSYLHHHGFQGKVGEIPDSAEFRQNATFYMEAGLADSRGVSFRAVNYPDRHLVVDDLRIALQPFADVDEYRKTATFKRAKGLSTAAGISFESLSKPGHFLRHKDGELRIDRDDGTEEFRRNATFTVTRPLHVLKK